jgi:hypothetical protein
MHGIEDQMNMLRPISPFQGFTNFGYVPRALPWAGISQAFGLACGELP